MPTDDVQPTITDFSVGIVPEFSVPELPGDETFSDYASAVNTAAVTLGVGARFTVDKVNVVDSVTPMVDTSTLAVPDPPAYPHPVEDVVPVIDTSVPLTDDQVAQVQDAAQEQDVAWTAPEAVDPPIDTPAANPDNTPEVDAPPAEDVPINAPDPVDPAVETDPVVDLPLPDDSGTQDSPADPTPAVDPAQDAALVTDPPVITPAPWPTTTPDSTVDNLPPVDTSNAVFTDTSSPVTPVTPVTPTTTLPDVPLDDGTTAPTEVPPTDAPAATDTPAEPETPSGS